MPHKRYAAVNFTSYFVRGSVEFRLFEFPTTKLHAGLVRAWVTFVLALGARAQNSRCTSSRKRAFDTETARFDFRVFLLHLGLIGEKYRPVRAHLLGLLPGDSAFRRGRPTRAGRKEAVVCAD